MKQNLMYVGLLGVTALVAGATVFKPGTPLATFSMIMGMFFIGVVMFTLKKDKMDEVHKKSEKKK